MQQRFAFILRLWTETTAANPSIEVDWRGSLELVESRRRYYFNSVEQLPQLLRQIAAELDRADPGQAGKEGGIGVDNP